MNPTQITAAPSAPADWKELAARESDGVQVTLLWSRAADRVRVVVADAGLDTELDFDVAGADALAAFHHPYAYAAALGLPFGDTAPAALDLQPQS
jgi:hypothetical protein